MFSVKRKRSSRPDNSDWVSSLEPPSADPIPLLTWGREFVVLLVPQPEGALLVWRFNDPDSDEDYILMCRLTEDEAQAVFEADIKDGVLESIRSTMTHTYAMVTVHPRGTDDEAGGAAHPFTIPRHSSEVEFVVQLEVAARSARQFSELFTQQLDGMRVAESSLSAISEGVDRLSQDVHSSATRESVREELLKVDTERRRVADFEVALRALADRPVATA